MCEGLRGLNQQLHPKVKLLLNKVLFFCSLGIGVRGSDFGVLRCGVWGLGYHDKGSGYGAVLRQGLGFGVWI